MVSYKDIIENEEIKTLINASCQVLRAMNYTEHGMRHANYVSRVAGNILSKLEYDERTVELARIAGYLHDVGNCVNRLNHGVTSATLIYPILMGLKMPIDEVCTIIGAIGNHEEEIGAIVNAIGAALVIADKSDAHRTRVRADSFDINDIHDRVNLSIRKNFVEVNKAKMEIISRIYMDDTSSVMEYFQIYLHRMVMSEKASQFLDCTFKLYVNDVLINSPKTLTPTMLKKIEQNT